MKIWLYEDDMLVVLFMATNLKIYLMLLTGIVDFFANDAVVLATISTMEL